MESQTVYQLRDLHCGNCAIKIEREVGRVAGVKTASLDFVSGKLRMEMEQEVDGEQLFKTVKEIVHRLEPAVKVTVLKRGETKRASEISRTARPSVALAACESSPAEGGCCPGHAHGHQDDHKQEQAGEGDLDDHDHASDHSHDHGSTEGIKKEVYRFLGAAVFFAGAILLPVSFPISLAFYLISYLLAGGPVVRSAVRNSLRGNVFDENFLMSIATLGAFAIGEYSEGVAVMLFYQVGELFQSLAVARSRKSIAALMDIRPDAANLLVNGQAQVVKPEQVQAGDQILVRPGEKVPLDGVILQGHSLLDTTALTGESVLREAAPGDQVMGGFINRNGLLTVEVTRAFHESTVSKILEMVEQASSKKAATEKFITKFARYYTPAVTGLAVLLAILPPLLLPDATFQEWIYRALVFLVVSCPCALVISIPLGFFGGIGGASRKGILIKGGNYLEALNNVDTVVFDKTGTLTKGTFEVVGIYPQPGLSEDQLLEYAAMAESFSNHPIAESISRKYGKPISQDGVEAYEEIPGHGVEVNLAGKKLLAGNGKLMKARNIVHDVENALGTVVYLAIDGSFAGYILIADEVKADAKEALLGIKALGVRKTVMLTGDNHQVGTQVGNLLGVDQVVTDLLPHEKVQQLELLEKELPPKKTILFVGDGVNDAPVLAKAHVGVAMGGLGSDAAIEAADVVLMTDEPSKLVTAIQIARKTRSIVWQNIALAFIVKAVVLILGAGGLATMWEAVFADVGVALLAVLNAIRGIKAT